MLRRALPLRVTVVVHTTDGKSLAGVLVGRYRDGIALAHARLLREDGPPIPLDGEPVVPAGNISFVQRKLSVEAEA